MAIASDLTKAPSDPLSNSAWPITSRSAEFSLTGRIPSERKSFWNLVAVQCPFAVNSIRSWGFRSAVCSNWWFRPPKRTISHPIPLLHSLTRWLSLRQTKHNPSLLAPFYWAAVFSPREVGYVTTWSLAPRALLRSPVIILCLEIHIITQTRETGVTLLRGRTRPEVFLVSFRQLPKTASSYSGHWWQILSSPNLSSLPFWVRLSTFSAPFNCKDYGSCSSISSSVARKLKSAMYSILFRAISQLSMRTAKSESASVSNQPVSTHQSDSKPRKNKIVAQILRYP